MADLSSQLGEFERASREYARKCAAVGIGALAQAFNHCDEDYHAHRYARDVQGRFRELCTELVALIETGEIERNPGHERWLRAEAAKRDPTLQLVLKRATRKTLIRSSRRQFAKDQNHA